MTRAEYEAGRAMFRLMCGLRRTAPVNPNRLQCLRGHPMARRYAALMLPVEIKGDPLLVPLWKRQFDFTLSRDGIPF